MQYGTQPVDTIAGEAARAEASRSPNPRGFFKAAKPRGPSPEAMTSDLCLRSVASTISRVESLDKTRFVVFADRAEPPVLTRVGGFDLNSFSDTSCIREVTFVEWDANSMAKISIAK
jgi:hypothetical protein